jgi:hypothetical protein
MQIPDEMMGVLNESLATQGYLAKIVSIERVEELKKEILNDHQRGLLDPDIYDGYLASFDFTSKQIDRIAGLP